MQGFSRRAVVAGGVTLLAGCVGVPGSFGEDAFGRSDAGGDDAAGEAAVGDAGVTTTRSPPETGTPPTAAESLPVQHPLSDLRSDVVSGGPGKDGIPSIDEPSFLPADGDHGVADGDVVFGVAFGDDVRAYPQSILVWHEIVNDELDGVPVSVTYCPLTGTAMGFFRGATTFGVSGRLVNNNLVMYDRATDSRWPQVLGTAISGSHEGASLREFPVAWTTWTRWREAHPDTVVLSRDTGHFRDYDRDPYGNYNPLGGYYASNHTLFEPLGNDARLAAKDVVLGVRTVDAVAAFSMDRLAEAGVLASDDGAVLAVYDAALDHGYVYRVPGDETYQYEDGRVRGPDGVFDPDSLPLERLVAFQAMWFAWSGFYPETELYD